MLSALEVGSIKPTMSLFEDMVDTEIIGCAKVVVNSTSAEVAVIEEGCGDKFEKIEAVLFAHFIPKKDDEMDIGADIVTGIGAVDIPD